MQYKNEKPFDDKQFDVNDEDTVPTYIRNFLGNGYQCKVNGTIDVSKVTGQLNFRQRGDTKAYNKFRQQNMDLPENE